MKNIYMGTMGRIDNGNLIEKLPDIIFSILVDEIGIKQDKLGNKLIDEDSFTNCTQKRKDWIGAFSLNIIKSRVLLNELLMISESLICVNSENKLRIVPLDTQGIYISITLSDLLPDSKGLPDIQTEHSKSVYNSFRIYYRIDYETKEYLRSEYISNNSTSLSAAENCFDNQSGYYTGLCQSSLDFYGAIEEYVLKSSYVRDRNTAVNLLKHITNRLIFKKKILTLKMVMNEKTLTLEIGDLIEINIPEINLSGKKFMVSKIISRLQQRSMIVTCYQIN